MKACSTGKKGPFFFGACLGPVFFGGFGPNMMILCNAAMSLERPTIVRQKKRELLSISDATKACTKTCIGQRVKVQWSDCTYTGTIVDAEISFKVKYDDGDIYWETINTDMTPCQKSAACTKCNRHVGRCNAGKCNERKSSLRPTRLKPDFLGLSDEMFTTSARNWKSSSCS